MHCVELIFQNKTFSKTKKKKNSTNIFFQKLASPRFFGIEKKIPLLRKIRDAAAKNNSIQKSLLFRLELAFIGIKQSARAARSNISPSAFQARIF